MGQGFKINIKYTKLDKETIIRQCKERTKWKYYVQKYGSSNKEQIDEVKRRIGTAEELINTLENLTEVLSPIRKQENIMTWKIQKLSNMDVIEELSGH